MEKQTPAWLQKSCADIVDEKLPIGGCPFQPFAIFGTRDPMETDAVTGDEIESLSQIRERGSRSDPRNDAANAQKLCRAAPKCVFAGVDSKSFVAKETAEVEKITGATPQIENLKRRRAIEPEVLKMLNVDADPVRCVFVGVDFSRVGSVRSMFAQPF